jgi:hypothetical protein
VGKRVLTRGPLGLAALGLAALAAGCGSSSASTATPPAATTTGTTTTPRAGANSAALQAYQACLKSQGVTLSFPSGGRPSGGQGGTPPTGTTPPAQGSNAAPPTGSRPSGGLGQLTAKQRAAMTACQSKLPAGSRGFGAAPSAGGSAAGPANAALKKYTACLKSHGVTFGSSTASSATFAKATAACKSLLPKSAATP